MAGVLVLGAKAAGADTPSQAPDFQEVYGLIRAHLGAVDEKELNRAAVDGLVAALSPRVSIMGAGAGSDTNGSGLVLRTNIFEGNLAYLRVGHVNPGLAAALRQAFTQAAATNRLQGLVLDLRYASGGDYAEAAAVADLFLKKDRPLLDWGQGMVRSKEKAAAISMPLAVLVNRQTSAAAEALAAVLREAGIGLLFGNTTAGVAMVGQEYPLKTGQRLRIATTPVTLGDGNPFPAKGLVPDILVQVSSQDERAYYADAFRALPRTNLSVSGAVSSTNGLSGSGTNRLARRPRFSEAELVRERRDGVSLDPDSLPSRDDESDKPLVHDPALARALDVLKGLAMVRQSRS